MSQADSCRGKNVQSVAAAFGMPGGFSIVTPISSTRRDGWNDDPEEFSPRQP